LCIEKKYYLIKKFERDWVVMKVSEIMLKNVIAIKEKDSLADAIKVLSQFSIDSAPVIDEEGHLKGSFTKREFVKFINQGEKQKQPVKEYMNTRAPIVYQNQKAEELIDKPEEKFFVLNGTGKLTGIITKTDILKVYLSRLKYVSNSLQALLESTASAIIAIDRDRKISFINKSAEDLLSVKGHEVLGVSIEKVLPESTLQEIMITGEKQVGLTITIKNRRLVTNRSPIIQDNHIVGAVAVFQDVTAYQALTDELASERHLRETLNTVLEIAYDGIIVTDPDGYITMISDTYKGFLGVEDQDVVGKHCTEVVENSRMHIVGKTGKPEIADIQEIKGKHMIASRLPIIKNGNVVGVVGKVLFRDVSELNALVKKVRKMEKELEFYKGELQRVNRAKYSFSEIIGASEVMLKAKELARKACECSANVLILGESGTGKELFAHAIHMDSNRAMHPFIKINCAAIPKDLLEAELFGYAEGAFTGAKKGGKTGKFELAQGRTVFLDEIGDMPLQMQAKLLRVLQEREIEPVGSDRCKEIDVRIIAATNRNLEKMVDEGMFREDLYYRLNVFNFTIPPLRMRVADIKPSAMHLLDKICTQVNKHVKNISPEAMSCLEGHHWPGNIRELFNVLERAVSLVERGDTILSEHLPEWMTGCKQMHRVIPLQEVVEKAEYRAIKNALRATGGNKSKTCALLNVSRSTLY